MFAATKHRDCVGLSGVDDLDSWGCTLCGASVMSFVTYKAKAYLEHDAAFYVEVTTSHLLCSALTWHKCIRHAQLALDGSVGYTGVLRRPSALEHNALLTAHLSCHTLSHSHIHLAHSQQLHALHLACLWPSACTVAAVHMNT